MSGVIGNIVKEKEKEKENERGRENIGKGRGNASMCVESTAWGMIGTTVDDGVPRCWVRGWVPVREGEVMDGVWWGIGGTTGGIFRLHPHARTEVEGCI